MSFNPDKCEVLRVTNKRKTYPVTYSIRGQELKQVNPAKYLGVDIDSELDWNSHIDCITKMAKRPMAPRPSYREIPVLIF